MSLFRRTNTITVDRDEYLALRDAVSSKAASEHLRDVQVVHVGSSLNATTEEIEQLLQAHYKAVLSSKEGRAMWRRLLRLATAVETVEQIGK